jgi:hypothetical protein
MKTLIVYTRHGNAFGEMGRYEYPEHTQGQVDAWQRAEYDVEVVNSEGGHAFIAVFEEGVVIPESLIMEDASDHP